MTVPADRLDTEFFEIAAAEGVTDIEELNKVLDRAVGLRTFLKADDRVTKVAAFVAQHFKENDAARGSCSTNDPKIGVLLHGGTVTLAIDLDEESEAFQDFVIAHELLHLKVPNHGRLFKALMTAHIPKWREQDILRRKARKHSLLKKRQR
jgi:predicted metal-dependent hydrolase